MKEHKSKILIFFVVLLTAVVSAMGVYIWSMKNQYALEKRIAQMESQGKSVSNKNKDLGSGGSTLETLDDTWQHYTNHDLGFSIDIPVESYNGYGSPCRWVDDVVPSYRPEGGMATVSVFEGPGGVYIANEYQYEMSGETIQDNIYYYSECDRVENTYQGLETGDVMSWKIVIAEVNNEAELEDYIQGRYGVGCSLGDQVVTDQAGVFDVSIEGDGLDLSQTQCPLNYMTVLKYYPAENKVASWHLGQSVTFTDETMMNGYDMDMVDSFRFE